MNSLKYFVILITLGSFAGLCTAQQVPLTHAKALNDSMVTFPQSDSAKPLLLLVGFTHKSQKQCDLWNQKFKPLYAEGSQVTYYELADFQGVPSLVMRMILHGMRREIPKDEHARFLLLDSNEEEWKKLVSYSASEDAYLIVADARGRVLWQAHGAPTDPTYSELQAVLAKQLSSP